MTNNDALSGPAATLERDHYGRPLVIPPAGGKAVAYTRCTTYVGVLEDTFNLSKWQQRQVALGLSKRPDLVLAAASAGGDKRTLDDVCQQAHDAAASGAAANTGTAIHSLAEQIDGGLLSLADVPADYRPDLAAYLDVTAGWTHTHAEVFTVHDDLKVGGTPDRISLLPDGRVVIADIKTGSVDYGIGKIAMQLALYSRSALYDIATGERTPLEVDQSTGIVIHVPAGKGSARLLEVDLEAGWEAVQLATQVRAWRSRKDLARELVVAPPAPVADDLPDDLDELRSLWLDRPDLRARIEAKVSAA